MAVLSKMLEVKRTKFKGKDAFKLVAKSTKTKDSIMSPIMRYEVGSDDEGLVSEEVEILISAQTAKQIAKAFGK